MAEINFKPDYGYREPSPKWFVIDEEAPFTTRSFDTRSKAEESASQVAHNLPGKGVLIAAVVARVATSCEVVGERFDARKDPLPPAEPEFIPEAPKLNDAPCEPLHDADEDDIL